MSSVRATVRLQFHREFTFDAAAEWVPYFQRLGVSHVYASPILSARPGSRHGYDVTDARVVNPELGGEEALRRFVARLREHGMGLIADVVPNHMAASSENAWWMDVLEWGRESPFAAFFDIDWEIPDPVLRGRVLAPFLGKPYGEALAAGEIELAYTAESGQFHVRYFDRRFPVAAREYPRLLKGLGGYLAALPRRKELARAAFAQACRDLASQGTAPAIAQLLRSYDARDPAGRERLHQLLERQHYRLAWWRTAPDEINWRRFFDLTDYIALRMEEPAAFEAVHATVLRLYAEGVLDGLRIDHVDGLADPRTYCRTLRTRLAARTPQRPESLRQAPYLVVEKILAPGERLARDWRVDGTTGYSFMNDVNALLHAPTGDEPLARLWSELTGRASDFAVEERRARRRIAQELLIADFNAAALALHRVARADRATRDVTLPAIRRVLLELLVQFPVYRTYAARGGRSPEDAAIMARAVEAARGACRPGDRYLVDLLDRWLGGAPPASLSQPRQRALQMRAITRFQQLSSPLAAKAVEDTAFYRHGRLLSRTEVGADPGQFTLALTDFHEECLRRRAHFPTAMLCTATHDHKRGEDARARLAVLSEMPARWERAVRGWFELNAPQRTVLDGEPAPAPGDEYMLYQALVGHWPLALEPGDAVGLRDYADRIAGWHLKAVREAKLRSSWLTPNEEYEASCRAFLLAILAPTSAFPRQLAGFVASIASAGAANSLSQALLRVTAPGVPDLYQGTELWDFSLVDPDNRRPVDYAARQRALAADVPDAQRLERWRDGGVKQQLIARALALRARHPALFTSGRYQPLAVKGPLAAHLIAYARHHVGATALVLAVRWCVGLVDEAAPRIAPEHWRDTTVALPPPLRRLQWRNVLDDARVDGGATLAVGSALGGRTCALLIVA